jgi:intraflagellar transport protein 172
MIKGEVESIERNSEKTSVYVREGADLIEYPLDALLIEFGSSFDVKDYARAIHLLESLEWREQVETMWKKLAVLALEDGNIIVAERCYAEMGDISSARYLRSTYKSMERIIAPDSSFYSVKAKIAILAGRYKEAETIYLQHVLPKISLNYGNRVKLMKH